MPERLPDAAWAGVPEVRFSRLLAPYLLSKLEAELGDAHQIAAANSVVVRAHAKRAPRENVSVFIEGDPRQLGQPTNRPLSGDL